MGEKALDREKEHMELKRKVKNLPMVIAVIGLSAEDRSKAVELAKHLRDSFHLRYSFIDHHDIALQLQPSLPSSSDNPAAASQHDDLCFNIVCQVASTQLKMEIRVVISAPLSKRSWLNHFDQLAKLALSADASLTVVQCQTQNKKDDFPVSGLVKLLVDTSEPFNIEKLVDQMLHDRELLKMKGHFHALKLCTDSKDEQNQNLHCKRCSENISNPSYRCADAECDKHNFHKSCAESASSLDGLRENCPSYLKGNKPDYKFFSEKHRCESCKVSNSDFSDNCHHCLFQTNMKLGHLPIVLRHNSHAHPLTLIIMPLAHNYQYVCCGCGEFGKSISYRCHDCNFNLHIDCVLLQPVFKSKRHKHPLALHYGHEEDDLDYEDPQCNSCPNGRNPENWVYVCEECKWVAHIACAI